MSQIPYSLLIRGIVSIALLVFAAVIEMGARGQGSNVLATGIVGTVAGYWLAHAESTKTTINGGSK